MVRPPLLRPRLGRVVAAGLCAASLALAQATPAAAAEKKVSFSFRYKMYSTTWAQHAGKLNIRFTRCWSQREFHALLIRKKLGPDTMMEGHTVRCVPHRRAYFDAPVAGDYYFEFTKLNDGELIQGNATVTFPR
ncbi:hypothetical protein ACH4Q6_33170 [Streptomyces lydicus]|uniref:hypothetical protein n=1 Tax=Streptomyces lydicus TaxID=47763 RepID=UPI003794BE9F